MCVENNRENDVDSVAERIKSVTRGAQIISLNDIAVFTEKCFFCSKKAAFIYSVTLYFPFEDEFTTTPILPYHISSNLCFK